MGTEAQKHWMWDVGLDIEIDMLQLLCWSWTYYHLGFVNCMRDKFEVFTHAMVRLCQALIETIDNEEGQLTTNEQTEEHPRECLS